MKKAINLFLISLLSVIILLPACSKSDSTQNNNLNTQVKVNDTIAFITLNDQENLFDDVHYALGSTVYGGTAVAINGQSVGNIPDLKGSFPMAYGGLAAPTITGAPPYIIDDKWIAADNRPNANYGSASFPTIHPPFELWMVDRNMPGQTFEAKSAGNPNGFYIGDLGGGGIRVVSNSYPGLPGSSLMPNYQTAIERLVIRSDNSADYYQNGVLIGNVAFTGGDVNNVVKSVFGLFVSTNCKDFDFAAQYFKKGTFSTSDAAAIYASLVTKWKVGSMPNQILLSNIGWTQSPTGTYTPSATVINTPAGATLADPSQWDYEWFWKDNQTNYDTQTLFSTSRVVHRADFPAEDGSHTSVAIKVRIRPKDTNGHYWRYISGIFGLDTDGSSVTP